MALVLVTYCSREKRQDEGLLPAWERYLSERVRAVFKRAEGIGARCLILSGEYGLIDAERPIPWYDRLLRPQDVEARVDLVTRQLGDHDVESVEYHTVHPDIVHEVRPYQDLLERACLQASIPLEFVEWTGVVD